MRALAERFWEKVVQHPRGCWEWVAATNRDGYGSIGRGNGTMLAHRVSWELHFGSVPEGLCVLHHCDNPPCVNPEHLFLGDPAMNAADRGAKGRSRPRRGELCHLSKLSTASVLAIRRRLRSGEYQSAVAAEFGVSRGTITYIKTGRCWGWLKDAM